jgi:acyl-coenzyme A thioesterase PaaI-like protein
MYAAAPINRTVPSRVRVEQGRAEVHLKVSRAFYHGAQALHGSMYFKALDDAAFFAANSVVTDRFVLTARFELDLLAPVTATALRAVGRIHRREGSKLEAHSTLYADGAEVARGRGLFIISDRFLEDIAAYRAGGEAGWGWEY